MHGSARTLRVRIKSDLGKSCLFMMFLLEGFRTRSFARVPGLELERRKRQDLRGTLCFVLCSLYFVLCTLFFVLCALCFVSSHRAIDTDNRQLTKNQVQRTKNKVQSTKNKPQYRLKLYSNCI